MKCNWNLCSCSGAILQVEEKDDCLQTACILNDRLYELKNGLYLVFWIERRALTERANSFPARLAEATQGTEKKKKAVSTSGSSFLRPALRQPTFDGVLSDKSELSWYFSSAAFRPFFPVILAT
jgi:hypothetical protein